MSFINLLGHLLCPQYPAMLVVASEASETVSQESYRRHGYRPIDGTVGRLSLDRAVDADHIENSSEDMIYRSLRLGFTLSYKDFKLAALSIIVSAAPIAINWSLSGFSKGKSEAYQGIWLALWLVLGATIGPLCFFVIEGVGERRDFINTRIWYTGRHAAGNSIRITAVVSIALVFGVPAIGSFVVVARMMKEYGVCLRIA